MTAHYTDLDRMITGAAVPTATPLQLPGAKETGTAYFLERREIGILNLGAPGTVRVGGTPYAVGMLDCLYIGLGEKDVTFEAGTSLDVADNVVFHFMGEPKTTRHLVVRDREAVLSPAWSIHCGAGTGAYRFVWAMGGDNQAFADMDAVPLATLQ